MAALADHVLVPHRATCSPTTRCPRPRPAPAPARTHRLQRAQEVRAARRGRHCCSSSAPRGRPVGRSHGAAALGVRAGVGLDRSRQMGSRREAGAATAWTRRRRRDQGIMKSSGGAAAVIDFVGAADLLVWPARAAQGRQAGVRRPFGAPRRDAGDAARARGDDHGLLRRQPGEMGEMRRWRARGRCRRDDGDDRPLAEVNEALAQCAAA